MRRLVLATLVAVLVMGPVGCDDDEVKHALGRIETFAVDGDGVYVTTRPKPHNPHEEEDGFGWSDLLGVIGPVGSVLSWL